MRIKMRDKIIFAHNLLWIERDPATKIVTFIFDGGIKLVAGDKVDFDKINEVLDAQDVRNNNSNNIDRRSMFEMIFGKDH